MKKVNLREKFGRVHDHWNPKIVGALNGQHVKIVKLLGEFVWHKHEEEDELFYVVEGRLEIVLRNESISLCEGEFFIVPKGVEHKPVAHTEAHVMLFEPASTLNTGDVRNEYTRETLEEI